MLTSERDYEWLKVGSIVRAPRRSGKRSKAIVATLLPDENMAELLWEDLAPQPRDSTSFRIAPSFPYSSEGEEESSVHLSKISRLLSFEEEPAADDENDTTASSLKEHGDTLLRLDDPSAAVSFYERALAISQRVQIGCTVVLRGPVSQLRLAEVDCLEDGTADVTFVDSQVEQSIQLAEVLCIVPDDDALHIRILLNLARCMMQLAEVEAQGRRAGYRAAAVLACSLVLILPNEPDISRFTHSALLIRSQAQAFRGKWQLAVRDVDQLLNQEPRHREGRKWRKELQERLARSQKSNRKLAKAMCQWVDTSLTNTSGAEQGPVSPAISDGTPDTNAHERGSPHGASSLVTSIVRKLLIPLILAYAASWILQQY